MLSAQWLRDVGAIALNLRTSYFLSHETKDLNKPCSKTQRHSEKKTGIQQMANSKGGVISAPSAEKNILSCTGADGSYLIK